MNKKLKYFLAVMFVFVISVSTLVFADVGNINRYDSGASSYDSGYNSGSTGTSLWSDNDIYDSDSSGTGLWSNNDRYDSGSSGYSYGYNSGNSVDSLWPILSFVVIVIIIIFFHGKSRERIQRIRDITDINKMSEIYNEFKETSKQKMFSDFEEIGENIRKEDAEFSEEKFLSWSKAVFLKIQNAWSKREWDSIRPFESNELFEQHQTQLQEYIDNNKINVIERVTINFAELAEHKVDGDKEILVVNLVAVMKDYIIDATTKQVLEGNKDTDYTMEYKMTFARKYGVKTKAGTSNKSTTNCPNCGAPTQVTSAGQCEYCGSIITTGEHDWVLTNIEGIK